MPTMQTQTIQAAPDDYLLGRNEAETRRLIRQGEFQRLATQRFLSGAGIGPGMRVLDVGSGAGDVALIAGELVGPSGEVVGVDIDPDVLETARTRVQAAGRPWISFVVGDLSCVDLEGSFDAVIGRLVLIYQPDPVATLRALASRLRSSGIVAFQEYNFAPESLIEYPATPLWEQVWDWIMETLGRDGIATYAGYELYRLYQAAGLPAPQLDLAAGIGGGPDWGGYEYAAMTLRSLLPAAEKLGIVTAGKAEIDTLAERLRAETLSIGGIVKTPDLVGAWARVGQAA